MNRRRAFSFLAIILLPVANQLLAASGGDTDLDSFRKKRGVVGSRQIAITPVRPEKGIDSGLVLAYGHIIPPPFKVEYSKRKLMINGVQVKPSLTQERSDRAHSAKTMAPEVSSRHKKAGDLMQQAKDLYAKEHGHTPDDALKKKIMQLLESDSDSIEKVTWNGWSDVCYKVRGFPVTMCDAIKPDPFRYRTPSAEGIAKGEAEIVKTIESQLRKGKWILFGDSGGFGFQDDTHEQVKAIMEDKTLPQVERFKRVATALNDEGCALDVIDNYSTDEWSLKRDKK